jgi:hypothetical protein
MVVENPGLFLLKQRGGFTVGMAMLGLAGLVLAGLALKNLMQGRVPRRWVPIAALAGVILFATVAPSEIHTAVSPPAETVVSAAAKPDRVEPVDLGLSELGLTDPMKHGLGFLALCLLVCRGRERIWLGALDVSIYAVATEVAQFWTHTRQAGLDDVQADVMGVAIGATAVLVYRRFSRSTVAGTTPR